MGWVIRLCRDDVRLGIGRGLLSLDSPRVTGLSPVFGRMKEGFGERDMMNREKRSPNGYQGSCFCVAISLQKNSKPLWERIGDKTQET